MHKESNLLKSWQRHTGHRQEHTGHRKTNRLTHIYKCISTQPVTCTQQLPVLYWMNNWFIQKFSMLRSTRSLLLKNYSLVKITYLLITLKKITPFPKNADSNGRKEQNPYTTQKEKDNFRKSYFVFVKKFKKTTTLWPLFIDGVQGCRATMRRQITFYHSVPRNTLIDPPQKDERLSWPWSQPFCCF